MDTDALAAQLDRYIGQLGQIGRTARGGIERPVYSEAWAQAREQVAAWMREQGLAVRSDAAGNLFGRLEGREPGTILTGSHFDTVPNGGAYDGALGIHAALTAVGLLARRGETPKYALEVVATAEEEGARFPCHYWAARAITGEIDPSEPDEVRAVDGTSIGEAMRHVGLEPERLATAKRTDVRAFLELHIEQGGILEERGIALGVVQAIVGQARADVTLVGRTDHAGTTPMRLRRDALAGAAEAAVRIEQIAREMGEPAVATVGSIRMLPGAVNVVAGQATFTVDMRHTDQAAHERLVAAVRGACAEIAERRGLGLTW